MIGNVLGSDAEQRRHRGLREPQRFVLDEGGDADGAVLGPVEGDGRFGRSGGRRFHGEGRGLLVAGSGAAAFAAAGLLGDESGDGTAAGGADAPAGEGQWREERWDTVRG